MYTCRGGDLGGTGGAVPKKFEMGDGPCIRTPNILRSSVVGCVRKYQQSKKRNTCNSLGLKEFFSEGLVVVVVLVRKGSYRPTALNVVGLKDMDNLGKDTENPK